MSQFKEVLERMKQAFDNDVSEFAFTREDDTLGFKQVHREGGEGKGEHWESVKYFEKENLYISVTGFYQSHNGTEFYDGWDSCKEVKPVQKTITVYE